MMIHPLKVLLPRQEVEKSVANKLYPALDQVARGLPPGAVWHDTTPLQVVANHIHAAKFGLATMLIGEKNPCTVSEARTCAGDDSLLAKVAFYELLRKSNYTHAAKERILDCLEDLGSNPLEFLGKTIEDLVDGMYALHREYYDGSPCDRCFQPMRYDDVATVREAAAYSSHYHSWCVALHEWCLNVDDMYTGGLASSRFRLDGRVRNLLRSES
jgi:hypothetical protein